MCRRDMKRKRSSSTSGVTRSFEEVRWVASLLSILGLDASPRSIVAKLHDGTRRHLFDMYTPLGDTLEFYGEYDGGYYHDEERVNKDQAKTLRIVKTNEHAVVLRTRVKAAHMSMQHERVCVVETESSKFEDVMYATAHALKLYLPEPYASRLGNVQRSKRPVAEHAAYEAWKELNRVFSREADALEATIGKSAMSCLMRVHGVRRRMELGEFHEHVLALRREFEMTTPQIVTFMSGCVATRLENEDFLTALRALRREFEMTTPQIVTFVSNSVATRLENEGFLTALRALRREFEMTTPQIVTFMSGCVAARLENEGFLTALPRDLNRRQVREVARQFAVCR
jgi:hypothetical protein